MTVMAMASTATLYRACWQLLQTVAITQLNDHFVVLFAHLRLRLHRCPDFLGYLCKLGDLVDEAINALVKLILGKTFDELMTELLEVTGIIKVLQELTAFLPDLAEFLDKFNIITQMAEASEAQLEIIFADILKLREFFNPR
jgi:hypothetical protein